MKEAVKKEILFDLTQAIKILEKRDKDYTPLQKLSNHAIEDVALHKDLDIISVTVLLYSLYKIMRSVNEDAYNKILKGLLIARKSLEQGNLGKYNSSIKRIFLIVKQSNAKVKTHLQDVMQAARMKKGSVLLQKGLSIGQAAGLMGLSNWDLQQYASKTVTLGEHREKVRATKRLQSALKMFGVSP